MAGIALGVAALIVVLSVMNGFQQELRARILAVVSHVQLSGPGNRIDDWPRVAKAAAANPRVLEAAPFINAQGMLTYGQGVRGVIVRGVLPELEERVADIGQHMRSGKLAALVPGEFGIVLGSALARGIGAFPGDKVALIAPQGQVTPAGVIPRLKQFTVVGTFEIGMHEYDSSLALIHLDDAQRLYQLGGGVSGVRLKLDDLFAAREVARDLAAKLAPDVYASDWTRSHANFFRAVEIEKRVMFIILTLIVAVAAFNIVSTLVMLVTDKQADIAILRTLGAAPGSILQIFVVQGAMIGIIGTLLGVTGGVLLALNVATVVPAIESLAGFKFLSPEVYYITDLPSDVQLRDVMTIGLVSLVMSFVATLYPSWRAARVNPAEALRYE
jgi:lipoprotein-releasing system permease protein